MRRDIVVTAWVLVALLGITKSAHGLILFEDIFFWMPDGSTLIDPAVPPLDAFVKLQETVYDDVQGRAVIQDQVNAGVVHGGPLPVFPIELYAYAITNLTYGNGPFVGGGAGVTGFNIPDIFGVGGVQWGPNAANDWCEVAPGRSGPGNVEWDIEADREPERFREALEKNLLHKYEFYHDNQPDGVVGRGGRERPQRPRGGDNASQWGTTGNVVWQELRRTGCAWHGFCE